MEMDLIWGPFLLWIDVVDDLNRDKYISFYRRWRNMNKKLKHFMIYAAIVIFTLTCGFCAIWNFMYCKDMLVCIIIIGYFMTMLLFSDRIEKGLSWDPFLWSSLWIETFLFTISGMEENIYRIRRLWIRNEFRWGCNLSI